MSKAKSINQADGPNGPKAPTPDFWTRHTRLPAVIAVFCGGTIGSLVRLALGSLQPGAATSWPWATMLVNLTGAFLLGTITEWFAQTGKDEGLRRVVRLGLGTGCIGGYTTYSTFIIETDTRFAAHSFTLAGIYLALSVLLGLICAGLGIALGARLADLRAPQQSAIASSTHGPYQANGANGSTAPADSNTTETSQRPANPQQSGGAQ